MALSIFIAVSAALAIVAFALLARPLLRRPAEPGGEASRKRALDARLAEIERARASGLIASDEAQAAEIEARRAALAMTGERAPNDARGARLAALAFLGLAPLVAALIYLKVGAPGLIAPEVAPPLAMSREAVAAMPEAERAAMIDSMVAGLAARLEQSPNDPDGWRMLARSQFVQGRAADSAQSYRRLFAIEEGTLDDWRNFAGVLGAAAPEGKFPTDAEFLKALDEIEKRAPGDMMARFYRGGAAFEQGEAAKAAEIWSAMLSELPPEGEGRDVLVQLIAEAQNRAAPEENAQLPPVPN